MIPAILLLRLRGGELGVTQPMQFFWYTGVLSSFLDNAPTYLTFLSLGENVTANVAPYVNEASEWVPLMGDSAVHERILVAISLGAVFMGANSYIGNAPNFMVKSIAESRQVEMPSFGGYLVWSFGILVPIFIGVTLYFVA